MNNKTSDTLADDLFIASREVAKTNIHYISYTSTICILVNTPCNC